jgi:LmbE family N-acetylglucosaminyl deacetylase
VRARRLESWIETLLIRKHLTFQDVQSGKHQGFFKPESPPAALSSTQEAAMQNRKLEDVVFHTSASSTLVIAAFVITALFYQLITVAVPLFESMVFPRVLAQSASRTLVAVFAHADDEGSVAPILARYAREGVRVYLVIATDGAQGGAHTSILRGPELARVRGEEARCATDALGIHAPILLGFPDAQLGSYMEDRTRLFQLTARVQEELERLRPDAVITWGPDGGTGHPDHRLVSSVVTQLVRAGAPGVPERLFYASLPAEGFRVMNPARAEPPLLIPQAKYFTTRVPFSAADLDSSRQSMACHKTQFSDDVVQRVSEVMRASKWELPLTPLLQTGGTNDVFR